MVGWIDAKAHTVSSGAGSWAEKWRDGGIRRGKGLGLARYETVHQGGRRILDPSRERAEWKVGRTSGIKQEPATGPWSATSW